MELRLGEHTPRVFYQTAIEFNPQIKLCARAAFQKEGASWREQWLWHNEDYGLPTVPRNPTFRRSAMQPSALKVKVDLDDRLVRIQFDDKLTVRMPYEDACTLNGFIERAIRNAKNWAGDSTRGFRLSARLTDAEEIYKIGAR